MIKIIYFTFQYHSQIYVWKSSYTHTIKVIITNKMDIHANKYKKLMYQKEKSYNAFIDVSTYTHLYQQVLTHAIIHTRLDHTDKYIDIRLSQVMHLWWLLLLCKTIVNGFHPITYKVSLLSPLTKVKPLNLMLLSPRTLPFLYFRRSSYQCVMITPNT